VWTGVAGRPASLPPVPPPEQRAELGRLVAGVRSAGEDHEQTQRPRSAARRRTARASPPSHRGGGTAAPKATLWPSLSAASLPFPSRPPERAAPNCRAWPRGRSSRGRGCALRTCLDRTAPHGHACPLTGSILRRMLRKKLRSIIGSCFVTLCCFVALPCFLPRHKKSKPF